MNKPYAPEAEVVAICRDLIGLDTSNYGDGSGPGERSAAEHVAALLDEVGIASELFEPSPGRTSVVAHWGDPSASDRLLVHGHLDVVPAAKADWKVDPFAAEEMDGYVWGRGAVDMKDFDAAILSVVRARARAGATPKRPITLAFTADEEAGSIHGAHPLVDQRAEWFEGCTEAVGEVGGFSTTVAGRRLYLVETAEKGLAWLRLRAHGTAGHGSMRNADNAVTALAEAVAAIGRHEWPVRITSSMRALLDEVAELTGGGSGGVSAEDDVDALLEHFGPAARMLAAVVRNTANPTMLDSGYKHNVIPGEATAAVDGRFLPGYEDEFFATLRSLLPESVSYELLVHDKALETPFEGPIVDAMTDALIAEDPEATVLPFLMSGGTDAKAWSRLGIRCFGFSPLRLPPDLDFTALFHGVDERVPVDALKFSARVFDGFLDRA